MKKYMHISLSMILVLGFSGCEKVFLGEIEQNTVLNNFDVFAEDFEEKYGLFQVRGIDWAEMCSVYREELESDPTEDRLYQVLTGIMVALGDPHVSLSHPTGKFKSFTGGLYGELERAGYRDMDFKVVLDHYLEFIDSIPERICYGKVGGDLGYIFMPEIHDEPAFYESYMKQAMNDLADTRGLILDLRNNDGGEDESTRTILGFFTDQEVLYMRSRYKTGPGPDDFSEEYVWRTAKVEGSPYANPVVLLTNRYTVSSGEVLAMGMKKLKNVTHLGDTTAGAFSDAVSRQLPNSWGYSLSVGDYRDADNISHEGIGMIPGVRLVNTGQDLAQGRDAVLEEAIRLLH